MQNAADPTNPSNWNKVFAAYLNATGGLVVPTPTGGTTNDGANLGAVGTNKIVGVWINTGFKKAGEAMDIMTDGEIVEMDDGKYSGVTAAQDWYVDPATGLITHTAPAASAAFPVTSAFYVGTTVEPGRLVVRFGRRTF